MFVIKEKENIIIKKSAEIKQMGGKLYIYGAGTWGKTIYDNLYENKIIPNGFCVDSAYYKKDSFYCGLPIIPLNSLRHAGG